MTGRGAPRSRADVGCICEYMKEVRTWMKTSKQKDTSRRSYSGSKRRPPADTVMRQTLSLYPRLSLPEWLILSALQKKKR